MKKVKVMLMSLLVVAAVGGALAFKTKSIGWYCTSQQNGACTVFDNTSRIKFATPDDGAITNKFCTDQPVVNAPCVTMTVE